MTEAEPRQVQVREAHALADCVTPDECWWTTHRVAAQVARLEQELDLCRKRARDVASGIAPNRVRPSQVIILGARMTEDVLALVRDVEDGLVEAVHVEAVAGIIEAIGEVLPEALGHNSLPDIVRGIGRQRDWQHGMKDHLADVARRLTDERDGAVAEAVAEERQRIIELAGDMCTYRERDGSALSHPHPADHLGPCPFGKVVEHLVAAGSVPEPIAEPCDHGHSAGYLTCRHGIGHAHDLHPTPWGWSTCPGPTSSRTPAERQELAELTVLRRDIRHSLLKDVSVQTVDRWLADFAKLSAAAEVARYRAAIEAALGDVRTLQRMLGGPAVTNLARIEGVLVAALGDGE